MKLSSAFVVVLVLHVVAVGGIYAFNALKAHQPAAFEETRRSRSRRSRAAAATHAPIAPRRRRRRAHRGAAVITG